jgi:DNA-binding PadR family transcriptional regulator
MPRWLQSGLRRDVCLVLYGEDGLRGKELKARLQDHYGDRVDTKRFDGMLSKLVDTGHVHSSVDGLHDVYSLTEGGERAVAAHLAWAREETGL